MVRRPAGFTLIELAIAIVLLAIGLLALTGALAQALHATTSARRAHSALREAESVADSLVLAGVLEAGARQGRGFRLEWRPAQCGAAACVRIVAALPGGDTLALLARPAAASGR